ncbi:hypothetical protein GCM10027047_37530 [Rhodococcus aerolatus]
MSGPEVSPLDAGPRKVARQTTVAAPVGEVFALVADPHRHHEIDGSGTVRDTVSGPERLSSGATFSVGMKQYGVPYKITSRVTAFEDDRLVEWQHPMGHKWRWEFAGTDAGHTQVTETFDYSTAKAPKMLELLGQPAKNAGGIEETLRGLARRFGG